MKNIYPLKIWKHLFVLCWALLFSIPAFCVNNLNVSGTVTINGSVDYSGVIGIYTYGGTHNTHNYWTHTSGSYTYYIYYNNTYTEWEIFTSLDASDFLFYGNNNANTDPPVNLAWTFNNTYFSDANITISDAGVSAPKIGITGNNTSITYGSTTPSFNNYTKFGSVDISTGSVTRTYTISNTGTGPLTISGISIGGTNADQFSYASSSVPFTVAASSTTTFAVTFNPSSAGTKTATVTVTNNDGNEGSYNFAIDGYGYTPQNLVVSGITSPTSPDPNVVYTHQGVLNNYEYWKSSTGYYLYNDGTYWYIDGDTNSSSALFYALSKPSILDAINWTGNGASTTTGTGTPVISTVTPNPNMNVRGNSTSIAINDNTPSFSDYTKFGSVNISSDSRTRTFTIENTGGAALTISGIAIGGTNAADFNVTTSPSSSVAANSSTTFVVTFDPSTEGAKTASISIASNDPNKNPYIYYISGDAFIPKNLIVSGITTPSAANGRYVYQGIQGEFQYWKHESQNYYIYNGIYSNTHYWYIDNDKSSISTSDYLFTKNSEIVAPVGLTSWASGTAVSGTSGSPTIIYEVILPIVTSSDATSVTSTSASLNGNVTSDGGGTVGRGFVYSLASANTNPQIGGTGVTKIAYSTGGTGAFSQTINSLTQNTAYYFNSYATNSAGTSYGSNLSFTTSAAASSTWTNTGNWSTSGNWDNGLPGTPTSATISSGTCTVDANATVTNLTVAPGAALTVNSGVTLTVTGTLTLDASSSGLASLINNGTITAGNTIARSYLTGGKWQIVAPVAEGNSISTFLTDANNAIATKDISSVTNYGMADYNEASNIWKNYFTLSNVGTNTFTSGIGYEVYRSSDGIVTFNGTLTSGNKTVNLTKTGTEGWNCIGNPYPSAIKMNDAADATNNFIKNNASNLDLSYACVYVWDPTKNQYDIINNAGLTSGRYLGQNYVAPGQGFFVKAVSNSATVNFTSNMQSHQSNSTAPFLKSAKISWPAIRLNVVNNNDSSFTVVAFNNAMTKGLDPTYDAGLLRGTSGLNLYSRLVKDNGVDFAVQCLPEEYDSLIIPIGVENKKSGNIIFSAKTAELPSDCKVILEDKVTGLYTDLKNGATYSVKLDSAYASSERFYLHTTNVTSTKAISVQNTDEAVKAYSSGKTIYISGELAGYNAALISINGTIVRNFKIINDGLTTLDESSLVDGIYVLRLNKGSRTNTFKLILEN